MLVVADCLCDWSLGRGSAWCQLEFQARQVDGFILKVLHEKFTRSMEGQWIRDLVGQMKNQAHLLNYCCMHHTVLIVFYTGLFNFLI